MSPPQRRRRRPPHPDLAPGATATPLGPAIDAFLAGAGMTQARTLALLTADWSRLVGDAAAAHCTPTVLQETVLTISVDHPAWATQLTLLGPAIVERCAQVLGSEAVTAVMVHVRG